MKPTKRPKWLAQDTRQQGIYIRWARQALAVARARTEIEAMARSADWVEHGYAGPRRP